eukprot:scaffold191_cov677-Pavlova_lutheri.AAC.29
MSFSCTWHTCKGASSTCPPSTSNADAEAMDLDLADFLFPSSCPLHTAHTTSLTSAAVELRFMALVCGALSVWILFRIFGITHPKDCYRGGGDEADVENGSGRGNESMGAACGGRRRGDRSSVWSGACRAIHRVGTGSW